MHSSNQTEQTECNSIISQAQDTTTFHPSVLLTEIHLLLGINMSVTCPCETTAKVKVVLVSRQQYVSVRYICRTCHESFRV